MVEMVNIHFYGNTIVMDCYPERDVSRKIELIMDSTTYEIISPLEINTYISMARFKIKSILKSGSSLPERACSVWC